MTMSASLLPEFDNEMANTRKVLECVPDDKLAWKPHEKSMTMGRLAGHVAEMPGWITNGIQVDELNLTPGEGGQNFVAYSATSRAELLATFDKNVAAARQALAGASDEHMQQMWSLIFNGKRVVHMPRAVVVRSMCMNHMIHHRAQLGVYLRLNDIAIPGVYGPSADEGRTF